MQMAETRTPLFLLDTHVWIWLMSGDQTLRSSAALPAIEAAIEVRALRVSVISVWEVGMLDSQDRIGLPNGCEAWTRQALSAPGISLAPLTPQVALASSRLPGIIHGDPADRILVATARSLDATLITRDRRILEYSAAGHVSAMPV